jgi:MoaA/NifB/PqqE/SkfB family radical SAM enzyme
MNTHTSIEPFGTPHFQITWEATLKCNLDCSYCSPNDHNNKIPHPSLEDCLKTVDFLLEYVDVYMENKNPKHRPNTDELMKN